MANLFEDQQNKIKYKSALFKSLKHEDTIKIKVKPRKESDKNKCYQSKNSNTSMENLMWDGISRQSRVTFKRKTSRSQKNKMFDEIDTTVFDCVIKNVCKRNEDFGEINMSIFDYVVKYANQSNNSFNETITSTCDYVAQNVGEKNKRFHNTGLSVILNDCQKMLHLPNIA